MKLLYGAAQGSMGIQQAERRPVYRIPDQAVEKMWAKTGRTTCFYGRMPPLLSRTHRAVDIVRVLGVEK